MSPSSIGGAGRRARRALTGTAAGRMGQSPVPRTPVEKTYRGAMPVSGSEPPRLTAYERRREARREQ